MTLQGGDNKEEFLYEIKRIMTNAARKVTGYKPLDVTTDKKEEITETIYFSTGEGGETLVFDAVFSTEHSSNLAITSHPIQTGADIADHAYKEADTLTFDIGMSDVMQRETFKEPSGSRSVNAYNKLLQLQEDRLPLTVGTRLKTYKNMMVETISTTDDNTTMYGLRVTVTLREIFVVNVATVKVSERPQVTESTNNGEQPAEEVKEGSTLSNMLGSAEIREKYGKYEGTTPPMPSAKDGTETEK